MILFAQMSDQIEYILEQEIVNSGSLARFSDTLSAMASVRPERERQRILQLLAAHRNLDPLESMELEDPWAGEEWDYSALDFRSGSMRSEDR